MVKPHDGKASRRMVYVDKVCRANEYRAGSKRNRGPVIRSLNNSPILKFPPVTGQHKPIPRTLPNRSPMFSFTPAYRSQSTGPVLIVYYAVQWRFRRSASKKWTTCQARLHSGQLRWGVISSWRRYSFKPEILMFCYTPLPSFQNITCLRFHYIQHPLPRKSLPLSL